jgi:hypothetical protein
MIIKVPFLPAASNELLSITCTSYKLWFALALYNTLQVTVCAIEDTTLPKSNKKIKNFFSVNYL